MTFDLTKLGWKAFQDLATSVAAEVLRRPVQTFLESNDGGRDGAFVGSWTDGHGVEAKSTIQCKFIGKLGANLTLSGLRTELPKAKKLAAQGLAEDYVILTNAGVSGEADQAICTAFEAVGVRHCRVFGGSWIIQQLNDSARLRMLVPRVYGLGDLSHIITEHAHKQAKAILNSMGSDLSCFVPTDAYRDAVKALQDHGFVILLGDPASGKSTIAAILTLGALDDGCIGAVKISAPEQLHLWHPDEKQVLWVDDAFGANHVDVARMARWNAELGALRAAIEGGARIVFTSRNYVWEGARPFLKMSAFPLFKESRVIVNVHDLSENERAKMLYNHVRRVHPRAMRQRLKPLLPAVAANTAFLPETARRLGDPIFTNKLELTAARLEELVEKPVEFLTEVLEELDPASLAAIALIFLNAESGVPSPIGQNPAMEMVTRLLGVQPADVAKAMQHLNDSLTRLVPHEHGDRWVFRHPTVTDAFAEIVAKSPEMVELYVQGAKLDRLIKEVACGMLHSPEGYVRIPTSLFPTLLTRFQPLELSESFKAFLGARVGKAFLAAILKARSDILNWAATTHTNDLSGGSKLLLAALTSYELLPEEARVRVVERVSDHAITWMDTKVFTDTIYHQILRADEFEDLVERFKEEFLVDLESLLERLQGQYSSENELGLYVELKDNMQKAQPFFFPDGPTEALDVFYAGITAHIELLEDEEKEPEGPSWSSQAAISATLSKATTTHDSSTIFDDVDD